MALLAYSMANHASQAKSLGVTAWVLSGVKENRTHLHTACPVLEVPGSTLLQLSLSLSLAPRKLH